MADIQSLNASSDGTNNSVYSDDNTSDYSGDSFYLHDDYPIRDDPDVVRITNNTSNRIIVKVGLYDILDYETKSIGCITLGTGNSYTYKNRFKTQLLLVSVGSLYDDKPDVIDVICYDLPMFEDFDVDDSFEPYKEMTYEQFADYSDDSNDDDSEPAENDHAVRQPAEEYIISNNTSKNLLLGVGLYGICTHDFWTNGWIHLPPGKTYTYISEYAAKILQIAAGFANENNIEMICEDMPIFSDFTFDDMVKPFHTLTYEEFVGDV